tara:strand:+ start:353 stop:535 length:183 start_codon:yes stop_codon:yes gene_type:complete
MILFLFLACEQPDCSAPTEEAQETTFLYPRKNIDETEFDMSEAQDTGYDTGDTGDTGGAQ